MFWSNKLDKPEFSAKESIPMPKDTNCVQNAYEDNEWRMFTLHNSRGAAKTVKWTKLIRGFYKATLEDGSVIFFTEDGEGRYYVRTLSKEEAEFKTEKEWLREFSRRLNFVMEYLGINQKDLSKMTGISQSSLSFYCCYKRVPSSYTLVQIANTLRVPVEFLSCFK